MCFKDLELNLEFSSWCTKSKDLKAQIDSKAIIVGTFNTLLSTMDRSSRHKINVEIMDSNYTLDQMDLRNT